MNVDFLPGSMLKNQLEKTCAINAAET